MGDVTTYRRLRHGYTVTDLDHLTRTALATTHDRWILSAADRYHLAWSGIAVALYTATTRPTREELVAAGWRALAEARDQEVQAHGWHLASGEVRLRPAFAAFWHTRGSDGFEDVVVERLAIRQVVDALTRKQRDTVAAVATLGSYDAAQEALGITRARLTDRLMRTRRRVLELWMPGETPIPPRYVHDRKPIRHGTPHGARAHRKRREKPCEACRAAAAGGAA